MSTDIRVAAEQARVAPMQGLVAYLRAEANNLDVNAPSSSDACVNIETLRQWAREVEAALAALPGDTSKEQALDLIGELEAVRTINAPEGYILASGLHTLRRYIEQSHSAATPAVESSQIAGRDGASAAPLAGGEPSEADWTSFGEWAERDRKDAARYRWLRDHGLKYANVGLGTNCEGQDVVDFSPTFTIPEPVGMRYEDNEWSLTDIDAAIDSALMGAQR